MHHSLERERVERFVHNSPFSMNDLGLGSWGLQLECSPEQERSH
jgi:hypothetical protein